MQVVYARCAGLDVHKKTVSACVSVCESGEGKWQKTRVFGTFTQDLLLLADWLKECGVTHVAMESTSVYWRPVWTVLEGRFEQMLGVSVEVSGNTALAGAPKSNKPGEAYVFGR